MKKFIEIIAQSLICGWYAMTDRSEPVKKSERLALMEEKAALQKRIRQIDSILKPTKVKPEPLPKRDKTPDFAGIAARIAAKTGKKQTAVLNFVISSFQANPCSETELEERCYNLLKKP